MNFRLFSQTVPDHKNHFLEMQPTEEEIKDTLMSIPNGKAPGPDGFSGKYEGYEVDEKD